SCPVTPAGIVGQVAQARGAQLTTLLPYRGEPLPRSTAGFDGLIILGGPMHAGDDANYPAFPALLALIRRFHAQGKPIFGICLGAQLIARAFGKSVYRFGGCEVGYLPVAITAEGANDPLLAGLAAEQHIMQMQEDSFDLPARAVLLMRNGACANQAFRLGRTTYGFQFHLEVTETDARNFPRDCWPALQRHFGAGAEAEEARVIAEVEAHYATGEYFCRTVTERWLDLVADCRAVAAEKRRRRAA
ncbi:MAG TPA: type 1 glutamine amidotransferase, partial [Candidatus Angelobacter sp.]|nr:type 1 glutamine amidotransferase [Candidatus Angelobacter sp.]